MEKNSNNFIPIYQVLKGRVFSKVIGLVKNHLNDVYGSENCQAGHYYSAGSYPQIEFNEDNVHLQGKSDNYFKSGNQLEYRKNLIKKIGSERVETLDRLSSQRGFKHDRFTLIDIIVTYQKKVKELEK